MRRRLRSSEPAEREGWVRARGPGVLPLPAKVCFITFLLKLPWIKVLSDSLIAKYFPFLFSLT